MSDDTNQQCRPSGSSAEDANLREKILKEIETKAKACSNPTYSCTLMRLDGQEYCSRHILRDPRANYRQCSYIYFNGKKCGNALPRQELKKDFTTYCFEHSRQAQLNKTHALVGKLKHVDTNETHMQGLMHHICVEDVPEKALDETEEVIDVVSPYVAPYISYDQISDLDAVASSNRRRLRILDYASDNSTDSENMVCINNTSREYAQMSDDESDDSMSMDELQHASVYTQEECVKIAEAKLRNLKKLYIDQISHLHYQLKGYRRDYINDLRKEREMHCSIHNQNKNAKERRRYAKLKALNTYHRRHGTAAVLHRKFKEKRARAIEGFQYKEPNFTKCVFTEGGVKCGERAVPCAKFCLKHILQDKKQILYRACGVEKIGVICQEPVANISDNPTCVLHMPMPEKKQFLHRNYESDTDDDMGRDASIVVKKSPITVENTEIKEEEFLPEDSLNVSKAQLLCTESPGCNITIAHD